MPRVHPRERGEAVSIDIPDIATPGPSPRARGSRREDVYDVRVDGSIPASAGKPGPSARAITLSRVHPRERGEAGRGSPMRRRKWGPSPRARGSRYITDAIRDGNGSIPASAGKPAQAPGRRARRRVHPRERGEAGIEQLARLWWRGPSPRARGSRQPQRRPGAREGSIPASAGKPVSGVARTGRARVHPRERGEASVKHLTKSNIQLSNSNEPGDLTSTAS